MATVLITGANRGIGNALVAKFLSDGWQVIACCRTPDPKYFAGMQNLDHLTIKPLEVTDPHQVAALAKDCENLAIDILLNVAGVYGPNGLRFGNNPAAPWLEVFHVNCIAPLLITEALVESVARSEQKLVACISSKMGSMTDNQYGNAYVYRSSKAALNAVVKSMSIDLAEKGIKTLTLHPGWVQTEMGGDNALISAAESADGLFNLLLNAQAYQSGGFYDYQGKEIPW